LISAAVEYIMMIISCSILLSSLDHACELNEHITQFNIEVLQFFLNHWFLEDHDCSTPCVQPFFVLAIYSQNAILKIESAQIMCFWKISIARIRPKLKKNRQIVCIVHQVCSQKYKRMLSKNHFHICSLKPNLAKSSSGELPLWITQKIARKKHCLCMINIHFPGMLSPDTVSTLGLLITTATKFLLLS
jgi:hypothetical protein